MPRTAQSVDTGPRFTCAQASRSLGLTAAALSARLRARRIEASGGTYSLRQLVDAMTEGDTPGERNARARAELASDKARLVRLEIMERENRFIDRGEALGFLGTFMRGIYDYLYFRAGLSEELRVELESEIEATATALTLRRGWVLEPSFSQTPNGDAPTTREQRWASMLCGLLYQAKEAGFCDEQSNEQRPGVGQSGGGRNRHARA